MKRSTKKWLGIGAVVVGAGAATYYMNKARAAFRLEPGNPDDDADDVFVITDEEWIEELGRAEDLWNVRLDSGAGVGPIVEEYSLYHTGSDQGYALEILKATDKATGTPAYVVVWIHESKEGLKHGSQLFTGAERAFAFFDQVKDSDFKDTRA